MPRTRRALLRTVALGGFAGCTGLPGGQTQTATDRDQSTATGTRTESTNREPTPEHVPEALVWQASVEGSADSRPIVVDGTVYVPAADLFAIDASGSRRWRVETTGSVWEVRPAPAGGVIALTGAAQGPAGGTFAVVTVDSDGAERWRFAPESPFLELLELTEETVYVGSYTDYYRSEGHHLWAVDLATGDVQWTAEIGGPSSAVVSDGTIYVGNPGVVRAFATGSGERRWKVERPSSEQFLHGVAGGGLVVEGDAFTSLATGDGSQRWTFATSEDQIPTGGTLSGSTLYAATYDQVHAVDPADGSDRWTAGRYPGQVDVPLVTDRTVYAAGETLVALAASDGAEQWQFGKGTPAWTVQPTDSTLVTGDYRTLYALTPNGRERWRYVAATQLGALGAGEGLAIAGDEKGGVYAFDAST